MMTSGNFYRMSDYQLAERAELVELLIAKGAVVEPRDEVWLGL
jgi:hypothetical protein